MIVRVIVFLLLSLVAARVNADTEPYCLRPVDPYPNDWEIRYAKELHKRIEPQIHTFVKMRVEPAFEGEFSVSIHGVPDNFYFRDATKCFVSYYAADKSISNSMSESDKDGQPRPVSVVTATVDIPLPLAKRIYTVWHKMLLKTCYAEDDRVTAAPDPTGVEFSSEFHYAQTWYPAPCKSAGLLMELGQGLIDYCKAPPEKRADATKALQLQTSALESFLKRNP